MPRLINLVAMGFPQTAEVQCSGRSLARAGLTVDYLWGFSGRTARELVARLTAGVPRDDICMISFWGLELRGLVPPPSAWIANGGLSPQEAQLRVLTPFFTIPARWQASVSFLGCTYDGTALASDPRALDLKTYLEGLWRAKQVEVVMETVPNSCAPRSPGRPVRSQGARRPVR
jgi:hypothetical protein